MDHKFSISSFFQAEKLGHGYPVGEVVSSDDEYCSDEEPDEEELDGDSDGE